MCTVLSVRADDNASQAAARAALMQKMQELNSQQGEPVEPPPAETPTTPPSTPAPQEPVSPPPTTPPPAEMQPPTPPPAETQSMTPPPADVTPSGAPQTSAPTPQAQTAPPVPEQTPAPTAADTDSQAAARAALLQKMHELDSQSAVPTESPAPVQPQMTDRNQQSVEDEEQALVKTHSKSKQPTMHAAPAMEKNSNPQQQLVNMEPAAPGAPIAPTAAPAPAGAKMLKTASARPQTGYFGFAPIQAPPPPVSPDQEAQLHALLEKYQADQITPDEYQAQRAAIIGPR